MKKVSKKNLTLNEFIDVPMPEAWAKLRKVDSKLFRNCKNFSDCHIQVQKETGMWIEELVPVFQKLDASLAASK